MEWDSLEAMDRDSLDDSLTSIQWLCQLESSKVMGNDKLKACKNSENHTKVKVCQQETVNKNPYRKPHYSYATLIMFAINSSKEKRMTLQEIYAWIEENFPYFKFANKGWKNSIRHNLSLHKFFVKEKRPSPLHGKGSYWRISSEGKENLMRDLLKQSHNAMQPPRALQSLDSNRKLRPIMPKPDGDVEPAKVQYVPLLTCSLPIVFVPSTAVSAGNLEGPSVSYAETPLGTTGPEVATLSTPRPPEIKTATPGSSHTPDTLNSEPSGTVASTIGPSGPAVKTGVFSEVEEDSTVNAKCPWLPASVIRFSPRQHLPHSSTPRDRSPAKTSNPRVTDSKRRATKSKPQVTRGDSRSGLRSPSRPTQLPNILRRKRKAKTRSPEAGGKLQTPKRSSVQPTLAAINSNRQAPYSPRQSFDDFVNSLTSSPLGQTSSFDLLSGFGSPGFSPLRSPLQFSTGLTPQRHDSDSGIVVTPVKTGLGEFGLNWTPFKTGLTPLIATPPTSVASSALGSQGCRKSLGLERIQETYEETDLQSAQQMLQ